MNRILFAVSALEKQLAERTAAGIVTPEAIAELDRKLDMSFDEWTTCQNRKSIAHALGKISHEEAQSIFAMMGRTPADFNAQPIARKAALTKVFVELMR